MAKSQLADVLTLGEVAALVTRLDGHPCSAARVRYVLLLGADGRAVQAAKQGATRLYDAKDVAIVRLAQRLDREGISPTVARVVLACLRESLIAAWAHGDPLALAIIGIRGVLVYEKSERQPHEVAWVRLRHIWRGIPEAIRQTRRDTPEVWQWRTVNASELRINQ